MNMWIYSSYACHLSTNSWIVVNSLITIEGQWCKFKANNILNGSI